MNISQSTSRNGKHKEFLDIHAVMLTNFLAPYELPIYEDLARRVRKLTILISTAMERNRGWKPEWGSLDVQVQKTVTLHRPWQHEAGFTDSLFIHIPWDTVPTLQKLRPDVVISQELGFRTLQCALLAGTSKKVGLVITTNMSEHTEQGRGWHRYQLRKWLLNNANCVTVNGSSCQRYVASFGVNKNRIFHVPYVASPISVANGLARRDSSQAYRLLFVGQLTERKGILPFTESLRQWATNNPQQVVEFNVVGGGPLEEQMRKLHLPENLHLRLLGNCNFDEVQQFYATSGILVFPTLADEWGLVVNEAMASGLPVVGSEYSQAVEDLCVDGQTGWRFRPDVPGEIGKKLDEIFSTPVEKLNEMRVSAQQAVEHLTPSYASGNLLAAIKTAIY